MGEEKVRENRLRRQLQRMGYGLTKSRIRDERAIGYGGYMITNTWTNGIVLGAQPYLYCLSLDDVEEFTMKSGPNIPKAPGKQKRQ